MPSSPKVFDVCHRCVPKRPGTESVFFKIIKPAGPNKPNKYMALGYRKQVLCSNLARMRPRLSLASPSQRASHPQST